MSSEEWNEVKRLAADFQKAQLSTSEQKLSERNCVEIINKLLETKLLNVIFTVDGKEYVTPQQLTREILDELYVHGGRINLVELANILNVDLSQVTERALEIKRTDSSCSIILGQLIDKTYLKRIAVEIDERLSQHGQLTIGDLTQHYDLPGNFLQSVIEKQLGKTIRGKQDKANPRHFFTDAFVSRNRACIRGALAAVTRPINISTLLTQCGVQEGVFFSLIDGMIQNNEVPGIVSGKRGGNGIYVPTIYSKSQSDWVDNFYRQNGYLEYDSLARLGISDSHTFLRKHFPNEKLMFLSSFAVGPQLFDMVESAVEESIATGTFVDIMPILPSVFEPEDAEEILADIVKTVSDGKAASSRGVRVFCGTVAMTDAYVQHLSKLLDEAVAEKAAAAVSSGAYQQYHAESKMLLNRGGNLAADDELAGRGDKRDERRKKATGGKGGGGTQGRETKMKSTKKKHQRGKHGGDDSDSDTPQSSKGGGGAGGAGGKMELLTVADVREVIEGEELLMEDDLGDLVTEIATYLHPSVNKAALLAAETAYELSMASGAQLRRKLHGELQDKLNATIVDVRHFEKGLKNFAQKETQQQLAKYLLKTLCTEIANEIFTYVAQEHMIPCDHSKELSIEARAKIMNDLPSPTKGPLMIMHKTLTGDSVDAFLNSCEAALGTGVCDMVLRKPDKKKERPLLFGHRAALLDQLQVAEDPSAVLLLAALVIYQTVTQTMLQASGRFVSQILAYIRPSLATEDYVALQGFYDLVMKLLSAGDLHDEVLATLMEQMPKVKEIATNYKKPVTTEKQAE